MIKTLRNSVFLAILGAFVCGQAWAGGSHKKPSKCDPRAPVLIQGPKGDTGMDGKDGSPGIAGENGSDGQNADADSFHANLGAEVRWYDWKHVALKSGYRFDTIHHGHTVDMAIVQIKLGSSYEERQMEALRKELVDMKSMYAGLVEHEKQSAPIKAVIRGNQ